MSNYIPMNPQIVDDPEFQEKPTWAKAIWHYLWCKCDFAGFAEANWRVIQVICNVEEPKTDEEIWEALEGLVVPVKGTALAYVKNYIQTARAQGEGVSNDAGAHIKIYKDMKMRKQRFKVKDPMSYAREHNPDLAFHKLSESNKSKAKEGETDKETPKHLFDVLGIPYEGYVAWNEREKEAPKSVSVGDDNKPVESSSYTQQDDEVEDIFPPVEQEQQIDSVSVSSKRLSEDQIPEGMPDQSRPLDSAITQQDHNRRLDEGYFMTIEGHYYTPEDWGF